MHARCNFIPTQTILQNQHQQQQYTQQRNVIILTSSCCAWNNFSLIFAASPSSPVKSNSLTFSTIFSSTSNPSRPEATVDGDDDRILNSSPSRSNIIKVRSGSAASAREERRELLPGTTKLWAATRLSKSIVTGALSEAIVDVLDLAIGESSSNECSSEPVESCELLRFIRPSSSLLLLLVVWATTAFRLGVALAVLIVPICHRTQRWTTLLGQPRATRYWLQL